VSVKRTLPDGQPIGRSESLRFNPMIRAACADDKVAPKPIVAR